MQVYSLLDLNEHIRRVLALNFQQSLWITAEIAQCDESRGHYFLDLVQQGEGDEPLAQARAALWSAEYRRLYKRLGPVLDTLLREGLEVKMQVRVEFHERYGLRLLIADIDAEYTLGRLDVQRRETIRSLLERGLLERNGHLPLPPVLQRIAVISSADAAGFQDFREHLEKNAFGYAFQCRFFASAVQGRNARTELLAALEQVAAQADRFDCTVIVRGGGARLDLAAFDGPETGEAVAQMPLPVFTGIGHDVDETVVDLTAHKALKTPTAVADFLIQHNLFFENGLVRLAGQIKQRGAYLAGTATLNLRQSETALRWYAHDNLRAASRQLNMMQEKLPDLVARILRTRHEQLEKAEALCRAVDPQNVLSRGYSLTMKNGKIVRSPGDVEAGDVLETRLAEGKVFSEVKKGKDGF